MKTETEDIQFSLNLIEEVCLFEEREYYNSNHKNKEYYKDSMHVVTIFNTRSN